MKNKFLLTIVLLFAFSHGYAKIWKLSNQNIEVSFDDQTVKFSFLDKRCNKVWKQDLPTDGAKLIKTTQNKENLVLKFSGKLPFELVLTLTQEAAVQLEIIADKKASMQDFAFPSALQAPDKNHYVLFTETEGLLVPVDDTNYPMIDGNMYFCGGGTAMSWIGMTDKDFKTGFMAIIDTPYDAKFVTKRANGLISFEPVWQPSMGKFGYNRKVTYHFFDKGGYVAQCKEYRKYIWKQNNVITLKEKEKRFPAISKLIGAVNLYVWDAARTIDFAKELKQSGIDKALFLWDANHTPYPVVGYDKMLKDLGFATGAYDIYTDLHYRDSINYRVDLKGPMRFERTAFPGLFKKLAAINKDGKTYFNQYGHTICPATVQPHMIERMDRELKEYEHETYFLDVYQANGLFECYNPEHQLTRKQFAEQVNKNLQLIEDKYGLYTGGEWGADYVGSNSIYAHGMMTLQRTWWGKEIDEKGSIYWSGDWKSNPNPSIMNRSSVAPDKYLKYSINEYTRVPLYELVYHDAVITSWRWEDGNHHMPAIWWKKDLFNILYGTAPLWSLNKETWDDYKKTFIQSYQNICPWLQKIGYDELVSHRFVTLDHEVQESIFSSGKKVVVNFSDDDVTFEGKNIKARGFITFENLLSKSHI
ncbi:hypothetical protein D0809_06525 [Flavobacterium circumlabens]|uniref:Glycosyl hydrolase family 101 n=1 Tax=Flavobacterium circumlabens TaxID=2133765 RepID=A0A4Y7UEG9_9FLAO|nr:glycoside hydrolase [Flavobacterium circumlabens]TCN59556.1 glycosyl hydrolase family 101 [Flavobacterium circumlabens]TEB44845.1 hypothetical protein D0809_06525 [Flavobacterium circumlabens]